MGEFELIRRYFQRPPRRADVVLGSGDDCALLAVPAGELLAVSTDTLVSGVHFFADVDPRALGHKALAVNLSDLAAMGATARWASLALTLPAVDEAWVAAFAEGFLALADEYHVELVGGDMTRGPLSITVTIQGTVPQEGALRRSGARPGDDLYVSGALGGAALALQHLLGQRSLSAETLAPLRRALEWPQPRLALGAGLRGLASAALDLSDGLASDLRHLLAASGVGAEVALERIPLPAALGALPREEAWALALAGGDDYELCFTAPPQQAAAIQALAAGLGGAVYAIGRITEHPCELHWQYEGQPVAPHWQGWDHFKEAP